MRYSVLLPAHRDDDYLAQAVASVEEAMFGDDAELIIIANGPAREAIVARYGGAHAPPSRRVLVRELPSLVHALNTGLEASRGEYIARMDSDDLVLPGRFAAQVERLDSGDIDFLFMRVRYITEGGERSEVRERSWPRFPHLDFRPIHPTAMIRREALIELGGYGNIELGEDRHLWLAALARGYRFDRLDQEGIAYRLHPGQSTAEHNRISGRATLLGLDLSHTLRTGRWRLLWHCLLLGALYARAHLKAAMSPSIRQRAPQGHQAKELVPGE